MAECLLTCRAKSRESQSLLLGVNEIKGTKFKASPRPLQGAKSYNDLLWTQARGKSLLKIGYVTFVSLE